MYTASDLRKGLKVELDGEPWIITDFDFMKPGKGQAIYRCKLKNMITGITMERSWRSNDRFGRPNLSERECVYSYYDGDAYVFSDNETFEEIRLSAETLGDQRHFLADNLECTILYFNTTPLEVTLPFFVEQTVARTDPAVRGDTATSVTKPAYLENGYELTVPPFINEGDTVKVDTRTGEYVERVSKA
jgi:elongation factor P